jgi:hypothetical protein
MDGRLKLALQKLAMELCSGNAWWAILPFSDRRAGRMSFKVAKSAPLATALIVFPDRTLSPSVLGRWSIVIPLVSSSDTPVGFHLGFANGGSPTRAIEADFLPAACGSAYCALELPLGSPGKGGLFCYQPARDDSAVGQHPGGKALNNPADLARRDDLFHLSVPHFRGPSD